MIRGQREAFNASFTEERYQQFLQRLTDVCGPIEFRVSETPCFFPQTLLDNLAAASQSMIGQLLGDAGYLRAADAMVPDRFRMPNGEKLPTFIQVDFGLVRVGDRIEGRLVELQAFPSLYGFQLLLAETSREVWGLRDVSIFPSGVDRNSYLSTVRRAIVGDHDPATVVLMEVNPDKQKTLPDFAVTEKLWGVRAIDVRSVVNEGRWLFYKRDGRKTLIRRIYNRLIPDDVERLELELPFDYRDDLDVEWTGSPEWFYRISKFSIPHLRHPWVPKTMFLSDATAPDAPEPWRSRPDDREAWLLKPLFSYAGGGIIFAPTDADIAAIPPNKRHLYVLQERVAFTPVIDTPHGPTQAEIRMMFVREGDSYKFVLSLVRMGRGKMMGVDHNKGFKWVGASASFIQ
jgi:hypothetical protein